MIKLKAILETIEDENGRDWLERHGAKFDDTGRVIAYHGTPEKNIELIKRNGFKEGSYFSLNPEYSKRISARYHNITENKIYVFTVHLPKNAIDYIGPDLVALRNIKFEETTIQKIIKEIESNINLLKAGGSVDIDDRFVLKNHGNGIFKVWEKFTNELALSMLVRFHCHRAHGTEKAKIPWVSDVHIPDEFRKNGLYRKILPILKSTFGAIRSYDLGPISDDAAKALEQEVFYVPTQKIYMVILGMF